MLHVIINDKTPKTAYIVQIQLDQDFRFYFIHWLQHIPWLWHLTCFVIEVSDIRGCRFGRFVAFGKE